MLLLLLLLLLLIRSDSWLLLLFACIATGEDDDGASPKRGPYEPPTPQRYLFQSAEGDSSSTADAGDAAATLAAVVTMACRQLRTLALLLGAAAAARTDLRMFFCSCSVGAAAEQLHRQRQQSMTSPLRQL